ncbi:FAD-dependent monooxygenase [Microbacterium sp. XT11]|uniref:FAD-dependent monooxygenase n=1 Tax=Microbacterium sp. XT11 TaxID=367477 RepID=UPI000743002D|nr:FAD-dependent monooxygenase [Microbacterium sp. XT11]ALX66601.1 2-polyprenyl-6-methoxyphenol hydroxylase [Microbacterium sp. XT11]
MTQPSRILIVGAGIGGLSTATALARIGAHVDVIDIKPDNSVAGVGFGLRINGLRALRDIGMLDDALAMGHPAPGIDNYDANGDFLSNMSYGSQDEGLPGCVTMARVAFLELAAKHARDRGCTIRMGTTVTRMTQDDDTVSVTFSSGESAEYDLVIGFDGINSQIRHEFFGEKYAPRPVGGVAWRAALPNRRKIMQPIICQGYGGKIMLTPLSEDTMYMVLTVAEEDRPRYDPTKMAEIMHDRAVALTRGSEFLADALEDVRSSENVAYTPYSTVWVPYPWFRGRVMIMGDAAHAMTPYLGSGAAMSIEDGVVFAQELAEDQPLIDAQLNFMKRRLPRVRAVHDRSIESMLEEFDSVTEETYRARIEYLRRDEPIANEYANRLLRMPY